MNNNSTIVYIIIPMILTKEIKWFHTKHISFYLQQILLLHGFYLATLYGTFPEKGKSKKIIFHKMI